MEPEAVEDKQERFCVCIPTDFPSVDNCDIYNIISRLHRLQICQDTLHPLSSILSQDSRAQSVHPHLVLFQRDLAKSRRELCRDNRSSEDYSLEIEN